MNEKTLIKEKLALGELPVGFPVPWSDSEQETIKQDIGRSDAEILSAYPPEFMVAKIKAAAAAAQTASTPAPRRQNTLKLWEKKTLRWAPLAAAAALILFFLPWSQVQEGMGPTERLKGGDPRFSVYRQTKDQPELLTDQALAAQGDRLQLSITVFTPLQGALVSLDGRGMVTVHHPPRGQKSTRLDPGEVFLPYSYILDDAPNFEKFYFITSPRPFDISQVTGLISEGTLRPTDPDMRVSVLTLKKGN